MKDLYKALAAFQQEVPHIYKGTTGYGYKYADWGQILDIVNPLLKKHGLGFTQIINGTNLLTTLFHVESGEKLDGLATIPQGVQLKGMNDFQVMGSSLTYMRRYALSAILGLVTDEDADGAGEQVKEQPKSRYQELKEEKATESSVVEELARAKLAINEKLEAMDMTVPLQKKAFILKVLKKSTIDTLDDANLVADAIDNEYDPDINQDGSYNKP